MKEKKLLKKKEGFTLIEIVCVIAIILLLAGSLYPKITGYIEKARKVKVVSDCRKVVMAVETYNLEHSGIDKSHTVESLLTDDFEKFLPVDELKSISPTDITIDQCYDIVNGVDFSIENGDKKDMFDSGDTVEDEIETDTDKEKENQEKDNG